MAFDARRAVFMGLGLLMVMGFAVYLKIWAIDSRLLADERELIRRQFDHANMEAMDESAEWRRKYDDMVDRVTTCLKEKLEIDATLGKKWEETVSVNSKLAMLQKENIGLLERMESLKQEVESLKQELEAEKLKLSVRQR